VTQRELTPRDTTLWCLVLLGQRLGLRISAEKLIHDYRLSGSTLDTPTLLKIASDSQIKAQAGRVTWRSLATGKTVLPLIARLKNGHAVIVLSTTGDTADATVTVVDPLSDKPEPIVVARDKFESAWRGEAILVTGRLAASDDNRPFGLAWFLPELWRQRSYFIDVAVAAMALHVLALAVPMFFQVVIDKVLVNAAVATLHVLLVGILIALTFDATFSFLRRYLVLFATNKIDVRVASKTFGHLNALPIGFFETRTAGVLTKHMQQTQRIREFLTGKILFTVLDATVLFVFVPILLFYSRTLTLVVLMFALVISLVIASLVRPFRTRLRALYQAEGERQALLVETIHGMRTVKSLALEPRQRAEWERRALDVVDMNFRVGKISASAQSLTTFLEKLMTVAVIGFGTGQVLNGTLSVGALVAFQMIAGRVSNPLVQLVSIVHDYQEAALSVRMLAEIMDHPTEAPATAVGLRPRIQGGISFEHVTFRYGRNGQAALQDVSFAIDPGMVVGVVGRSGSGKTTLTRLIQRLYPVQEGCIRVDGYDVREIDLYHLRRATGTVLQENFIFRGTVRDNISVSRPDASFEEIVDTARLAGADEFIQRLPQGYDTMLEEEASNLSGGQRQRIAIARALLPSPRILILDEATSALDPESEAIVQRNLKGIAAGRTVIIVSHRLSMIKEVDMTIVIEGGQIVGAGKHDELLSSCFTYRQLWAQQNR
jgi:ATP-binding cassette subfamily B protein